MAPAIARRWLAARLAAFFIALLAQVPGASATVLFVSGRAAVIDGNTIEIRAHRIKLYGIAAPQSRQLCEAAGKQYDCGLRSALALATHLAQRTVTCQQMDADPAGHIFALCTAGPEDLGAWMVSQGWALAYRKYTTRYVTDEDAARSAGRGLWRGTFTPPWDWHRGSS